MQPSKTTVRLVWWDSIKITSFRKWKWGMEGCGLSFKDFWPWLAARGKTRKKEKSVGEADAIWMRWRREAGDEGKEENSRVERCFAFAKKAEDSKHIFNELPPYPVLILKPWNKDPTVCKDDTRRRWRFNKSDKVCVLRRESSAIPEVLLVSLGPYECVCVCVAVGRESTHTPALP